MSTYQWIAIPSCLVLTLIALQFLRLVAVKVGLVDHPNERKVHSGQTPLVGGIAIFLGLFFSLIWWLPTTSPVSSFLVGAGLVVFIGILDDLYDLSVRMRIIGQVLAACVVALAGDTFLLNVGNLFAMGDVYLGPFAIIVTVIAFVGMMNAFNMIDGIDGLLGGLSLIPATAVTLLCLLSGDMNGAFVSLLLCVALLPFIFSNLKPKRSCDKVFMGDAGSLLMGFTLTWLFIVTSQSHINPIESLSPVTALFLVAVPMLDLFTVIARRIKQKRSPFRADRQHLHHLYEKAGYDNRQSLYRIIRTGVLVSAIGVAGQIIGLPDNYLFIVFGVVCALYVAHTKQLKRKADKISRGC